MTIMLTLADVSTTLVELESHPGLEHLRRYSPTGVTARRWEVVEAALQYLWNHVSDANLDRANAAYAEIKKFLDAVELIDTMVASRIAPLLKQLDSAGAAVPKEVTDLLAASASDPLSLTSDEIDRRIATIAELAAFQANWPAAVAETSVSLDALRSAIRHATQTRERATRTVLTGPLPVSTDVEPTLRAELDSMTAADPTALLDLQRRIASAVQRVGHDEALAKGLLDRRSELKGRLRVYAAKAARLGLGEDQDLMSSQGTASGLLAHQPCDLRAVTQAVVDYQQTLAAKRGATR
jgi:hypothetical protein